MNYFVTAIDTDSGKSLVSSILVEALKADYWKPVQAGFPTDTNFVKSMVTNTQTVFHPEAYVLKTPASPHAAAAIEAVDLRLADIQAPETANDLVIEGAGGALVPLNDQEFVIDLANQTQSEVVLVSNLYLGSINHTLLTIELLKQKNCRIKGIIFNGEPNPSSEEFILKYSGYPCLLRILPEKEVNKEVVKRYARDLVQNWNEVNV